MFAKEKTTEQIPNDLICAIISNRMAYQQFEKPIPYYRLSVYIIYEWVL